MSSLALTLVVSTAIAGTASGRDIDDTRPVATAKREPAPPAPSGKDADALEPAEIGPASASGDKVVVTGTGTERQTFLIQLRDAAVPSYTGGLSGLPRTAPRLGRALNTDSAAAVAYESHLVDEQSEFVARMERVAGRDVEVPFTYQFAANGLAADLTPAEARAIAGDPAVVSIVPDEERELYTDSGPSWSGVAPLWNAVADLGLPADVKGEGTVVGVIDDGISPGNRSFADPAPGDGFDHTNPLGAGTYLGVCNPDNPGWAGGYDPHFPCNDKLIGAYAFTRPLALDTSGHGSHTASIAGGNVVKDVAVRSPVSQSFDISGVAPHANIVAYLGCCAVSGLTAAIDQAIADEVDVINYSIGGAEWLSPWDSFDAVGFLNARAAGIFVAVSSGDHGPSAATTRSQAEAPWVTSVGASSHDRHIGSALTGLTSSAGRLADIVGQSTTAPLAAPTPIVYAGTAGDPLCEDGSGHEAEFTGRIVVCDRGVNARLEKALNVAAQGAVGFVLISDQASGYALIRDHYAVPGVFVTFDDGAALKDWLATGSDHLATIASSAITVNDRFGDIMAQSSSQGPSREVGTIVPAVTAPGVNVLAAQGVNSYTADDHGFRSGTSMSAPHVAGAGALLTQARPGWTPAEMQSALMTTARPTVLDFFTGQPATPYAQGSGHIDVGAAVRAGLLFDETFADYVAANPAHGGDPTTLNLPSFADSRCLGRCSWQRTATVPVNADAAVPGGVSWTASVSGDSGLALGVELTPAKVSPGEGMTIDVTADVRDTAARHTLFGRITLTPDDPAVPTVTVPVAVVPIGGDLPDAIDITTRRDAGSHAIAGLRSLEVTEFTASVTGAQATLHEGSLAKDPTPFDAFDRLRQVDVYHLEVPPGSRRLVAEMIRGEMDDVDLYLGEGDTPTWDSVMCLPPTFGGDDTCDLADPAAGTWWVLVQNYTPSTSTAADDYVLATGVIPGDDLGVAGVAGPEGTVPLDNPYDARFHWDIPALEPGDLWYGTAVLGTSPATPGNIGSIPVTLRRAADDVTATALVDAVSPGDTISHRIAVQPNVTTVDRRYMIMNTVPDGLTVVPGSVTGGGVVDGQTITWDVETLSSIGATKTYVASTPATDEQCAAWAGFIDIGGFPLVPIDGDSAAATAFANIGPFELYGQQYPSLTVTEDGMVTVTGGHHEQSRGPQVIPDAHAPNGVIAPLWSDLELARNAGRVVRMAIDGYTRAAVIQWDNPFEYTTDDSIGPSVGKFQAWIYPTVRDDRPEVTFEYADLGALPDTATIGIENVVGDMATSVLNAGDPRTVVRDGGTICLDYRGPTFDSVSLAYDVTVDADAAPGVYTTEVVHVTDDPFATPATASVAVEVGAAAPTAPSGLVVRPGNRSAQLSWSPPVSPGNTAIRDYVIQQSTSRRGPWRTVPDRVSTARRFTVTGLTNGTRYFFRVGARNAAGTGAMSAAVAATPRTVPSRPQAPSATPRRRAVRLTWIAPARNGGARISDYVIQRSTSRRGPWRTVPDGVSTARRFTVTGLTNGTRYFFRIAARNAAGTGTPSFTVRATPQR